VGELTATVHGQVPPTPATREWIPSVGSWPEVNVIEGQPVQARVSLTREKKGTDPAGMM